MGDTTTSTGACSTVNLSNDLFNIDPVGGAQISMAIVLVWSVGWVVRQLVRLIRDGGSSSTNESE